MKVGRCGSLTGREWHAARGEPTCDVCKAAYTAWQNKYRKRVYLEGGPMLIPAIGTQRRIQALAWMGWNFRAIAEQAGIEHERSIGNILARRLVHRDTAARLHAVFEKLCMVQGPSVVTASRAHARGWASWAEWNDIDNPAEVPSGVIEACHEEAIAEDKRWRENQRRRRTRKSRARINAQNYQRRKQRDSVAA